MKKIQWMMFVLLLMAAGCKNAPKEQQSQVTLTGHEWELKTMTQADSVVKNPEQLPTLVFSDSAAVYGFAGCNRFFGTYGVEKEGGMTITPGGATMMYCPDLTFEDAYLKALAEVKEYAVSGTELRLTDGAGTLVLVYGLADTASAESVQDTL